MKHIRLLTFMPELREEHAVEQMKEDFETLKEEHEDAQEAIDIGNMPPAISAWFDSETKGGFHGKAQSFPQESVPEKRKESEKQLRSFPHVSTGKISQIFPREGRRYFLIPKFPHPQSQAKHTTFHGKVDATFPY